MNPLTLKGPFEPRKASTRLREMLVDYLATNSPAAGTPFYSDNELMDMSGLSRKAVRKAMDELQREGWIERQIGRGSFVGHRAAIKLSNSTHRQTSSEGHKSLVRLAVLAFGLSGSTPDWYSQMVLQGIDDAAIQQGVSIELIGSHTADVATLATRLAQSRPDVLAVMPSTSRHALVIGQAMRMEIPCILTGTRLIELGLPTVCEDGRQGAALAVKYLVEKGHRRIAFIQHPESAPWVFARREGYLQGLVECGIAPDERLVCWLNGERGQPTAELQAFLDRERPTALLLGSGWHLPTVGALVRAGTLRIPQDLSLITFDHMMMYSQMELGVRPTSIALPLREMGRRLAAMARDIVDKKPVETETYLPCELLEGESVAACPG